jgi:hypothetical protein
MPLMIATYFFGSSSFGSSSAARFAGSTIWTGGRTTLGATGAG